MTWKQLADKIAGMSEEKQNTDATVLLMDTDEVFGITDFVDDWKHKENFTDDEMACGIDQVDGILDNGHPFVTVPA